MRLLAPLLVLLALIAAGCGGGDEPSMPAPLGDGGADTSASGDGDELAGTDAERGRGEAGRGGESAPEGGERDGGSRERSGGGEEPGGPARGRDAGDRERERGGGERDERGRRGGSAPVSPSDPRVRDDVDAIKATVRRFFDGLRDADGSICGEVTTQHYMEVLTGERGAAAVRACRARVERGGVDSEVTAFGPIRINRDVATAEFNLRSKRGVRSERLPLARQAGRWKVDAP